MNVPFELRKDLDFVCCVRYSGDDENDVESIEKKRNVVQCHLTERQRCSQEILEFGDYVHGHDPDVNFPIKSYLTSKSFSKVRPIWAEFESSNDFSMYFEEKLKNVNDVMVVWDESLNLQKNAEARTIVTQYIERLDIEAFCEKRRWKFHKTTDIRGCEASVVILYDLYTLDYERVTRAKHQLFIITMEGRHT